MTQDSQEQKDLEYFNSVKGAFQVISFIGKMSKNALGVLEICQGEIVNSSAKNIVLHFRDVTKIENPAIPQLVRLQKAARDAKKIIRISSVRPEIKELLLAAAAIRHDEIVNNLPDALKSFPQ